MVLAADPPLPADAAALSRASTADARRPARPRFVRTHDPRGPSGGRARRPSGTRIFARRDSGPRARHRRQHSHFQHRQCRAAAAAAVRRARSPRSSLSCAATSDVSRPADLPGVARELLRLAARIDPVRRHDDLSIPAVHAHGRRRSGSDSSPARSAPDSSRWFTRARHSAGPFVPTKICQGEAGSSS